MSAPIAVLDVTVLDAPEPRRLADFYCALLGWSIEDESPDWVTIRNGGGPGLAFQLSEDFVPPSWPDHTVPQQFHLDVKVPDIDVAEPQVLALGATATGLPGGPSGFRVYRDPAGHPFCLCRI